MEENTQPKKLLLVANVVKEHVLKFHVPTIRYLKSQGWTVDVAASGEETVPHCDRQIHGLWKRSPFTLDTLRGVSQLRRIIDEGDYDIVYCHTPVGALVARLAARRARKRGTKVVYFAHGFHFFTGAPLIYWLLFYPIERLLAHSMDLLITLNDEDYARARRRFPKKLRIEQVPGVGVDFARLDIGDAEQKRAQLRSEWGIPQDAPVLIYVAELIANKNQKMLLEALKKVKEKHTDTYLVLVGPDHANGYYQQLAQQMGVADSVVFTGWRSDIGACLRAADIAVASSMREGLALNIVEAMYCQLPVVATDNRGHVPIIRDGENGFLVHVNDSEKMAQRVIALLDDPQLREQIAGCDVSRYSAHAVSEKIYNILKRV
ncbi:MAG: glycosyltransferase family 4 protein [Clostridiales bacterium]|nr:glycosyltransferase family 4 protein [Clostridiales bacterium]